MNNNAPRRKGFSFLSFFLGILMGIILVIGTVAGVIYYVLSGKIDDVFNTVGMPNKDEEGNNVYINTDKENGGVETLLELVTVLGGFISDTDNLSVGKVEKLVPAVSGVVDGFYVMLNEYVEIDRDEFTDVKFSELGEFVQDKVLDIQPAKLLDGFGMGGALDNKIISIIFNGSEAEYVTDAATGEKYPAYYDGYYVSEGKYLRSADNNPLPDGWDNYLVPKNGAYRLYYCTADGVNYVADSNLNVVSSVARIANAVEYAPSQSAKLSGNYYYENGEKVTITPITLRSLADGGFDVLNDVYLTELLSDEGNDLANKVLSGISLGSIMNGEVNFEEVLSNLPLTDLFDTVSVEDKIMTSLIYRVSGVSAVEGQNYTHVGTYKNNGTGETFAVNIYTEIKDTENGPVQGITKVERSSDGKEIISITVADLMDGFSVDDIMNDFTVPDFVDVNPTDGIICYLAYGIYGVNAEAGTCKIEGADGKDVDCTFTVNGEGLITSVTRLDNGENVAGTPINEISGKINGLSTKLTIRELITNIEEGSILDTLGDYTVNNIEAGINELTIGQIVNCEGENVNSLLVALKDTKIRNLSNKINELTVSDVMGKEAVEANFLLKNLSDTKISDLPEAVSKITINTLYAEEIYKVTTDEDGKELPADKHIPATMKQAVSAVTDAKTQILFSEEYVYYTRSGDEASGYKYTIVGEGENLGKLTNAQFLSAPAGTYYYTYGKAQGMWEMLLYVDGSEKAYELENLTDMVENVSNNMNHSKLKDLHNSGLLKFTHPSDLNKLVPIQQEDGSIKMTKLGDLELTEALGYLASILEAGD